MFPAPVFDIIPVEDKDNPGHGFLVIWVARSAGAPHAFSPQGTGRHYPRRVGTEKVWLSEAEIAEAYRARFADLTGKLDQADKIETDFLKRLSPDQIFVIVTLVPDLPGRFTIDNEALRTFDATYVHKPVTAFGIQMNSLHSTLVRYRRLAASGSSEARLPYSNVACELHQDGSGAFASMIDSPWADPDDQRPGKLVDNNHLVLGDRRSPAHARHSRTGPGRRWWPRQSSRHYLAHGRGCPHLARQQRRHA